MNNNRPYTIENVEFTNDGIKVLTKEEWEHHLKGREWIDFTMVNQISDIYYTGDRTGAEAIIEIWRDLGSGKIDDICAYLNIPDKMGFIHAVNTLSKHYVRDGRLSIPQGAEKWRASKRDD